MKTTRAAKAAKVKKLSAAAVNEFFAILSAQNPHPRGELAYTNPYTLLVAVVLSAQATDVGVNKATKALFARVSTPRDMLALGEAGLKDYIKTIGLYNSKAKNLMRMAAILEHEHNGEIPQNREQLQMLPGVGRKSANVVMNMAFGAKTIAVDTHIFRVSNRTGLAIGDTPLAVELGLEAAIAEVWKLHAHHWLILHGRYICKARKPLCRDCPVQSLCGYGDKSVFM